MFIQQRKASVKEKDNHQNGEKNLANEDTHKEFMPNTYKQLVQLNIKKKSNKKLANDLTAHFSKDAIEMAIKHKKRC